MQHLALTAKPDCRGHNVTRVEFKEDLTSMGEGASLLNLNSSITLRSLLGEIDPTEFKLHCAVWNGSDQPLDVFARSRDEWLGWNAWRPSRNEFNRRFIFSMMNFYHEKDRWLFGGVFEVLERDDTPNAHSYTIAPRPEFLPGHIGRLKLKYRLPGRAIRRKFESNLDQIEVAEILPVPYEGRPFPGHDRINISLAELQVVVRQDRSDWRGALEHMKGVYVIHDRTTGKPYIGSAYGDTGIWARWKQYAETLHGNNVDLRELVEKATPEDVAENLNFALLEFWSMRTNDAYVLERESYWKNVLLSREYGHNKN